MCNADDYLLSTPPMAYGMDGMNGQSRVCRDWSAFLDWANQHNACYTHISDDEVEFAAHHEELERYRNCPEGSPYTKRMEEYFESK